MKEWKMPNVAGYQNWASKKIPSSPHQWIPLKQSHMPGTSPLACVAPFCLRFFQPFSLAPSTSFTPTLFINPMMDRCLRKNPHFVDQGDMKIGKQDTQSALLMFWINKALCYRQLFLHWLQQFSPFGTRSASCWLKLPIVKGCVRFYRCLKYLKRSHEVSIVVQLAWVRFEVGGIFFY